MIEVAAGNTLDQIQGAWTLWLQWCAEEGKPEPDYREFCEYVVGNAATGRWVYVLAWDGDEPVGMVEVALFYDPFEQKMVGVGDHAFVAAGYRGTGVFRQLADTACFLASELGATKLIAPANAEGRAAFTKQAYERMGFRVTGYCLTKEF